MTDWTPPQPLGDSDDYGWLLELAVRRPEWHHRAACHGQTGLMFPDNTVDALKARAVCAACPVQTECAAAACDPNHPELHGTWGGMSEKERRRVVYRARKQLGLTANYSPVTVRGRRAAS